MTNQALPSSAPVVASNTLNTLAPLVLVVFLGFLAVGTPLSALSLHIHDELGFDTVTVGLMIGVQSLATILTRHQAGVFSDRRGPKQAILLGLPLAALSGLFYLCSVLVPVSREGALVLILLGRLAMGYSESLFITGAMSWGIGRLGRAHTGKVVSWAGIAMFVAVGLGAPSGLALQTDYGFVGVAMLTIAAPMLGWLIALFLQSVPAGSTDRVPFYRVLGFVWRPGLVLALAAVPFAAIAALLPLHYAANAWTNAGLAMIGFAGGFMLVRLFFSHLPDRLGGAKVAAGSLIIEAAGQALLWLAPSAELALAGATLTGVGFSLVYPAMGVETTRRLPPEQRGRALGNFSAFFDLALLLTGPVVGLAAQNFGYPVAFLIGTGSTIVALLLLPAMRHMRASA